MKLTPVQARNLIAKELNKGHGIYVDCRYYNVRIKGGVLELFDGNNWTAVPSGAEFRNPHGRTLFTYEPAIPEQVLTVLWSADLNNEEWVEAFPVGAVVEVVRETATQYVIAPMGFELRVSKSSLRVTGFKKASGVQFQKEVNAAPVKTFISGNWHVWQGTAKVMLSDELSKELKEFDTVDDCINWLFVNEHKEVARALNKHAKEGK